MIRRSKVDINQTENPWIIGCADWVWEQRLSGWDGYYMNFMFRPYPGKPQTIREQMVRAICKGFYSRFCTEFTHHPTKPSQQPRLPRLWLFPDRPAHKTENMTSIREMQFNDNGVHYNGPMMIPPASRFRECPIQHIHENQKKYAVLGLDRIHVKKIDWDSDRLIDYAGKTIKRDKEIRDDILILPSFIKRKSDVAMSAEDRAIRDVQAQYNVSQETAVQLLNRKN